MASTSTSSSSSGNKLKDERSPYLLQHASNPVHWYPWGEEAFKAAKEKNKMIFLSVGYSTCHWCHVMERESFESDEVAAIMNEHFINVKVDREERPDVDKVYMSFVQATSGGGGWPMSVFLTPSLKPVFGGTYFPPDDQMFGRPGFKSVLLSLAKQWEAKQKEISESGDNIIAALGAQVRAVSGSSSESIPDPDETVQKCASQLMKGYDAVMGGFSRAPKFPQPVNFNFLLRQYAVLGPTNDYAKQGLKMVLHTLEMMSKGGIYDHVSDGFARYSTDENWHVPHFEKMLYDQGQLLVAYAQAYQATKDEKYRDVINGVLKYVTRDLRHEKGGFYSAEDADSLPNADSTHKKEGAFCVWTMEELKNLLDEQASDINGHKRSELFAKYFNAKDGGNVSPRGDPHGELKTQNVLTLIGTDKDKIMQAFGLNQEELETHIKACIDILHNKRQTRPRPHLDDKILTAWNGLMISGLCAAGNALQNREIIDMGVKTATFLQENMWNKETKKLYRSAYTGKDGAIHQLNPPINGFVDDYAFLIRGLLDLYEATFDCTWLEWANDLQKRQDDQFWDNELKGYFTSPEGDPSIVLRLKEDQDGAEPASNSVTSLNLIRLSVFLDKPEMKERAKQTMIAFKETLLRFPIALPEMTSALMTLHHTPVEIIITGDPTTSDDTKKLVDTIHSTLLPHKVLILADGNQESILYKNLSVLKNIPADKPGQAFVCKNYSCSAPVCTSEELLKLITKS